MERGVENLEGLGWFPGADIVARAVKRADEGMGTGGQDVQAEIVDGVGAQLAHVVADIVAEGFAENESPPGVEGAGGAGKKQASRRSGELVEDIVEENHIEFFG